MNNYWQGKYIKLRAFEERDLEKYIRERSNPDSIRQFYEDHIEFPLSEVEIRKTMDAYISSLRSEDKRLFVVENLETNEYVGEISIWSTNIRSGVFKYGIFLDQKYRGQGHGKQALIIVLDYYFNELNYQKCSPNVYSYNLISQHFHDKFGFVVEGQLRSETFSRGTYHDVICYGMLRDEFNKLYSHDFI